MTKRQRSSRRPRPTRVARDKLLGDPKLADDAHERVRQALEADLRRRRECWPDQRELHRAIAALRAALTKVLGDGAASQRYCEVLERLERDPAVAPVWCRTPEDWWLAVGRLAPSAWLAKPQDRPPEDKITGAARELDDDQLAVILSPGGYRRNREKAITAVRVRRATLNKRCDAERSRERAERIAKLKKLRTDEHDEHG